MIRRLVILACFVAACCCAQVDNQQVWNSFVEWLKSPAAPDNPPEMMKAYVEKLSSSGLTEAQVKERMGVIQRFAGNPANRFTTLMFNKIYASPSPSFRPDPSAFLVRAVAGVKPGKALDVAMGQGRNTVYLASKGWDTTGYDVSDVGLAVARANAEKAGVKILAVQKSHQEFDFGEAQWDLIALVFPLVSMDDAAFMKRVRAGLKPGGMIVVEQFNAAPAEGAKGPANALFKTFQDFRVVLYEDMPDTSDWGKMKARIGRIAAVKE
jgi:2-polyprenyl-3-methyl-5-hydroxy-6-metoxy-1,4-benzoquinol methylase